MHELKPCPFCGREPEYAESYNETDNKFTCKIYCFCGEGFFIPLQSGEHHELKGARTQAETKWNWRYRDVN